MLMTDTYIGQCLDFPINSQDTPCHVKVLMQLSRASGLYLECPSLKGIEIEEIPVAHGGYGDVYKGLLHGKEITVKALRVYWTSDTYGQASQGRYQIEHRFISAKPNHQEFLYEAVLWQQLSHPNVLPFYGVYHPHGALPLLCVTSPWMAYGNVVKFLKNYQDTYCSHLVS